MTPEHAAAWLQLLHDTIAAQRRERHEHIERQLRALAPLAGRIGCTVCHGKGAVIIETQHVSWHTHPPIVVRCHCTTFTHT